MGPERYDIDRQAAATESLEHAIELLERNRNPALVMSVGHFAWQHFFDRARPRKKGLHARLELIELVRIASDECFDRTWLRQRAVELAEDLQALETRRSPSPRLRIAATSPVFLLVCAVTDFKTVTGSQAVAFERWRQTQLARMLDRCRSDPQVRARHQLIGVVGTRSTAERA